MHAGAMGGGATGKGGDWHQGQGAREQGGKGGSELWRRDHQTTTTTVHGTTHTTAATTYNSDPLPPNLSLFNLTGSDIDPGRLARDTIERIREFRGRVERG